MFKQLEKIKIMMISEIGSIPLFSLNLKLDSEKELNMKNFINKHKNKEGRIKSNVNGYQSEDILEDSNSNVFLNFLKDTINYHVDIFSKEILQIKKQLKIKSMWLNINNYKDYNNYHTHPGSIVSGTFYVNTFKNCGKIKFYINDLVSFHLNEEDINYFNRFNSSTFTYFPNKFDLIFFPGWVFHSVEPNMDKKNSRISISFNCS